MKEYVRIIKPKPAKKKDIKEIIIMLSLSQVAVFFIVLKALVNMNIV